MNDLLKYLNNNLSELNLRLSSLGNILQTKEVTDLKGINLLINEINKKLNEDNLTKTEKNKLNDIKEVINAFKFDLASLKTKLITTDEELKQKIKSYNVLLNYTDIGIREKAEILNKKISAEKELNKYDIKPIMGYGYKGRLNINNVPFDSVNITAVAKDEFYKIDETQKNLTDSMITGFKAAGNVLATSLADAIIPMNKVKSLAESILYSFIQAATKAMLFKTILGGVESIFGGGFVGLNSFTQSLILPQKNITPFYEGKNYELLKSDNYYKKVSEITLNIPKVEFKQSGYDLRAVIKKLTNSESRYL